jgi:hypothetical protein
MGTAARVIVTRHGGILLWLLPAGISPGGVSGGEPVPTPNVAVPPQGAAALLIPTGLLSPNAQEVSLRAILGPAVGLRSACDARRRPQDLLGSDLVHEIPPAAPM